MRLLIILKKIVTKHNCQQLFYVSSYAAILGQGRKLLSNKCFRAKVPFNASNSPRLRLWNSLKTHFNPSASIIIISLISSTSWGYNSELIQKQVNEKTVKTYYPRHLSRLRKAVQPRVIHYVDARNYRLYGKLMVKGILFTHSAPSAQFVSLVSDIDKYREHKMIRNKKGIWYYILQPPEYVHTRVRKKIKYKFKVDGLFDYDRTHNMNEEDFANSLISYFYLIDDDISTHVGATVLHKKPDFGREILFRVYAPRARRVSLVGNFNNWNSGIDAMKQNESGYYEIYKVLAPGEYIYLYKIDGNMQADKHNLELKYHQIFGRTSYLKIQ